MVYLWQTDSVTQTREAAHLSAGKGKAVVSHLCSPCLTTVGMYLKSAFDQERDPTSFEEGDKTLRMFEVTFVVPNLHARTPN